SVDGAPVMMAAAGYRLAVEEHPRYTFRFTAAIPAAGFLAIRDTNYVSSEGTSRLALRGRGGVVIDGYEGPPDVDRVPIRPIWDLSDAEERRTKQVEVRYLAPAPPSARAAAEMPGDRPSAPDPTRQPGNAAAAGRWSLAGLLDRGLRLPWAVL